MPNPITILLKDDHKQILENLKELQDTAEEETKERKELFNTVRSLLMDHAEMEEKVLYPVMKEEKETHEEGMEAAEEHNLVKLMLAEMSVLPKGSDRWKAKATVLYENVKHHIEEEEKTFLPHLEEVIPESEIENIAEDIRKWKEENYSK